MDNFKTIFGVKDNIQALRNKVLELAIQGKLVEQDPNDEPASELIRKIQVERTQLVKEGKIKKQKSLNLIEEDEITFEIPENWEWVRLREICYKIVDGSHNPPKGIEGDGYPMLSAININKTIDFDKPSRLISSEDFKREHSRTNIGRNDVLLTIVGTIGRAVVVDTDELFTLQRSVAAIKTGINPYYLLYLLLSPFFYNQMYEEAKGTAQVGIYLGTLNNLKIPVPPIVEQDRIVNKIESLMSGIDKLEKFLQKKEHLIELLPKAVVEAIGSCKTGEALKEQLQFVIENFKTVFQTPDSMQELRNVVLQLAIEGKLVPQDSKDEPASVLIGKIKAERDELIKEGKLKKQKPIKSINETDMLEIPESWEIEKLGNVFEIQRGSSPRPKGSPLYFEKNKTEFHWITIWDITNNSKENKLVDTKEYLTLEGSKHSRYVEEGEIIIAVSGSTVGKTSILGIDGYIYDGLAVVKGLNKFLVFRDYLFLFLQSWKNKINNMSEGSAFPNINTDKLNNLLITIPPEAEQHRIVQKVESIMALIDQIEAELMHKDDLVKKLAI